MGPEAKRRFLVAVPQGLVATSEVPRTVWAPSTATKLVWSRLAENQAV